MKVILKEDVKNLGRLGDIVTVSDGYARNYLVPKQLAVEATKKNLKEFEHQKKIIMKKAERIKGELKATAERLSAITLTITAKSGEENKLFGSVTNKDIADALKAEGFDIEKKRIVLEEPIKRLGTYEVDIKFDPEISSRVKVEIISGSADSLQ